MKKTIIFLLIFSLISLCALPAADICEAETELYACSPNEVKHFFTHALVAYPEIGFASDNPMRSSYMQDCLTPSEFSAILDSLYSRGYALVDVYEIYRVQDGIAKPVSFSFPTGKKPLLLSFDDINYYSKKAHYGMCDRLILSEGEIATYTRDAPQQINCLNETVTILEDFIRRHPDFSYNGARGVLCLTGYDGVLGYRTQSSSPNRESEIAEVRPVISELRARGWRFASHSYGHGHMRTQSDDDFLNDVKKWRSEVAPLVGDTDIYCYPYGEWDIASEGIYSVKQQALIEDGFRLFFGVGADDFFGYVPWQRKDGDRVLLMDRKPLDGYSLRAFGSKYAPYFDCSAVYSSVERRDAATHR